MGKLGAQPAREYHRVTTEATDAFLSECIILAQKYDIELRDVFQAYAILEHRRQNTLYVSNGDNTDEQTGGFGELFHQLNAHLESIASSMETIRENTR